MFTCRRSFPMFRRGFSAVAIATQILWLTDISTLAFERALKGSVLEVRHRAGLLVDSTSGDKVGLDQKPTYLMRHDDRLKLLVTDPNPLLFSYNAEVTEKESADHAAAASLAKALAAFIDPFRTLTGAGPTAAMSVEGLPLEAFKKNLGDVLDDVDSIQSKISQSIGTDSDIAAMKNDVASWDVPKLAAEVHKGYDALATIAAKCLKGLPLQTGTNAIACSAPMPGSVPVGDRSARGTTDPAASRMDRQRMVFAPIDNSPFRIVHVALRQAPTNSPPPRPSGGGTPAPAPGGPRTQPTPARPAQPGRPSPVPRTAAKDQTKTQSKDQNSEGEKQQSTLAVAPTTILDFTTLALSMQTRVDAALDILQHFVADVGDVNSPKPLPCGSGAPACEYSLQDRTVTIAITPATRYDTFMTDAVKTKRAAMVGRHDFELKAYSPVALGFGPAFVARFLDTPTFTAVKSGDHFVIQSKTQQSTGYNVAAMLTMTPRAWSEPTFGGQFQLGVSPAKDQLGLYLGAGITVQKVFTFGGGFVWQQVQKLDNGLSVGQNIDSAEALKTGTEFKPGFYVHATVNVK